ncbi:MAG: hypothetical protein GXP62_16670 [Oligoflexia bacterium]|nr:hypothetical protein [Oligoflexia bacterium]
MLLLLSSIAFAGEVTINPSTLPASVTAAVQTRLPGAAIVSAAKDGKDYEVAVTVNDRKLDLAFAADGTWLEEEEEVALTALPAAVQTTLASSYQGWTAQHADRAESPSGVVFEVVIHQGKKAAEVALTEAGLVKSVEHGSEAGEQDQDNGRDEADEDGEEDEENER